MVILASFQQNFWIAFVAATTMVLGAAYTLWMYKRVIYGPVANDGVAGLSDIDARETVVLVALVVVVLAVGLWPAPLVDIMGPTVDHLLDQVVHSKLV